MKILNHIREGDSCATQRHSFGLSRLVAQIPANHLNIVSQSAIFSLCVVAVMFLLLNLDGRLDDRERGDVDRGRSSVADGGVLEGLWPQQTRGWKFDVRTAEMRRRRLRSRREFDRGMSLIAFLLGECEITQSTSDQIFLGLELIETHQESVKGKLMDLFCRESGWKEVLRLGRIEGKERGNFWGRLFERYCGCL